MASLRVRPALLQLVLVRFREFYREPEALFWVYAFPILLAAGLGLAFRSQPAERIRVGWAGWTAAGVTRKQALERDSALVVATFDDSAAAHLALRSGRIAILAIPVADSVAYRFDDTRPEAALARLRVDRALQAGAGRTDPVPTRTEIVRERGSRYIDFLLPGLLGMNIMGSGIWGSGFVIVDARRKKLLKRLVATPMSKTDYLASFLLAQLLLLVLEVGTLLLFGVLVFGVPIRGSLALLGLVCVAGSLTFGALGLLVAARPRTMEGASGLMNLIMLPMWVLSGVFFSSARFPDVMQPLVQALPLTAVVNMLRAVMLEGAHFAALGGELAVLLVWLVVAFGLALKLFRWR
jgi:ABC-type polysaccharide/polyol phosphate export permease